MSKKISIVISVILFIILMVLIVCEKMNPEAGTALIHDRGVLNEKKALRKGRKSKALQKVFFSSAGICGNLYCDSWCCNGFA